MIAAIRARFTETPEARVWNDTVFNNWLNTAIPFSLAHFWNKSSFGQVDLRFQVFPPIVLDDPRANMPEADKKIIHKDREYLVNGVTAKLSDQFDPDWTIFDGILIWFAQPTDLFGGGSFPVGIGYVGGGGGGLLEWLFGPPDPEQKFLPVAVCDIASTFDLVCQELGHLFGFEHPRNMAREDYGDPYDSMASRKYGELLDPSFQRPHDPQLPAGAVTDGFDPQTNIGPLVSAANLYISPVGQKLKTSGLFVDVPPSYLTGVSSVQLFALDHAIEQFPGQKLPVLAVLPPSLVNGDIFFLELRRKSGYDNGLKGPGEVSNRPPMGVVIHLYDSNLKKVVYVDTLPVVDNAGDRDYHVFGGGGSFTFRITAIGPGFRSVNLLVGGSEFWRNFGINIEESHTDLVSETITEWRPAFQSPCFLFPPAPYTYRFKYTKQSHTIVVSSFGYEAPGYVWKINDQELNPAATRVTINTMVQTPDGPNDKATVNKAVDIDYTRGANSLSFTCDPAVGNFTVTVEVKAVETSPSVLKNVYEDRAVITNVTFRNLEREWDVQYRQRQKECKAAIDGVNDKRIPQKQLVPTPGDPQPFELAPFVHVINTVVDQNPALANTLVNELSKMTNLTKLEIVQKLK